MAWAVNCRYMRRWAIPSTSKNETFQKLAKLMIRLALDPPVNTPFHFTRLTFWSEGNQIREKHVYNLASLRVLVILNLCLLSCWQNKNKVTRIFCVSFLIKIMTILGIFGLGRQKVRRVKWKGVFMGGSKASLLIMWANVQYMYILLKQ